MRTFKDEEYKITFDDREYLEDLLDGYNISPEELCYQMTAYENDGIIDYEDGIRRIISDFSNDEPDYNAFYEFLENNDYEKIYPIEEFEEIEKDTKPFDIVTKAIYGDLKPSYHKYFTFDDAGNYKGYFDIKEAIKEYESEFNIWYYDQKYEDLLSDDEFKSQIISGTLQLVKQGY